MYAVANSWSIRRVVDKDKPFGIGGTLYNYGIGEPRYPVPALVLDLGLYGDSWVLWDNEWKLYH
jgi:hypothetical protein